MKKLSIRQLLIIFGLGIMSTLFLKNTFKMLRSGKRLDDLRVEVELLEEEKESLIAQIEYKKTDEFVEEQARNNLNLIKPNEEVFILPNIDDIQEKGAIADGDYAPIIPEVMGTESEKGIRSSNIYLWYRLLFH